MEQLDDPSLRGLPVVVGARPGHRGVVSTCSYEARAFGIHSAMPISEAVARCPDAVFLTPRMARYAEMSRRVMEIFAAWTPDLRRVSIDEAFLDMTGTERLFGPPAAAATALKARVREETGLGISVGVAPNAYVAKIASGLRKPDGLVLVPPGGEEEFMRALPLKKLWGAGEKTQERFRELGIGSVADLVALGEERLATHFGKAGGSFLLDAALGRDRGMMEGEPESRSASAETTFERDVRDREILEATLMELIDGVAYRLWDEGLESRTLFLKLRLADWSSLSRRRSRPSPYRGAAEATRDALALLDRAWDGRTPVRLIGAGFAELREPAGAAQGELFPSAGERRDQAEKTVFELEKRGLGSLRRARLLEPGSARGGRRRGGGEPG